MRRLVGSLLLALIVGCDGGIATGGSHPDDPTMDDDGDGISNGDEGSAKTVNTDGDKFPDYLDFDSDGDGISDEVEAGDKDIKTPPLDTDKDGIPDFQDTDSDNDGLLDTIELDADFHVVDTDKDGI